VMRCVAVCVLQCVCCGVLQCVCCGVLQCVCCGVLQCVVDGHPAVHFLDELVMSDLLCVAVCALQCFAVCVLRCVAVSLHTPQPPCNTLQRPATHTATHTATDVDEVVAHTSAWAHVHARHRILLCDMTHSHVCGPPCNTLQRPATHTATHTHMRMSHVTQCVRHT